MKKTTVLLVIAATMAAASLAAQSGLSQITTYGAEAGWKVPRTADGKVDGDKISFVENVDFQGMPLKIVYTGQMTSADEIKMTRNVADLAMEQLVAKRVK